MSGIIRTKIKIQNISNNNLIKHNTWNYPYKHGICLQEDHRLGKVNFFFFFLATPCSMWDLSSLTRDQTRAPCRGSTGC